MDNNYTAVLEDLLLAQIDKRRMESWKTGFQTGFGVCLIGIVGAVILNNRD